MVKEVIWSPLAVETYDTIIQYLLHKFGESSVRKFVALVDAKIEIIKSRPRMFRPSSKRRNTYITSLNKKGTLTYKYKPRAKQVELIVFWGMQNPDKKPF